ncbi:uncharacterized protein K02A2.6-like [Saccostrea cucullata]|uniref:uncharacterized protein K02A2.6-like n=1 Tax=Saccostrea cuccullata TaxID=36930 RepID=UPI002ED14EC0
MNIITPVSEPIAWVSSCLMVVKANKVRICIDPKDLNKALKRSHYPLPTIEEILPNLSRAKVFSVLDARNGFWHAELDKESSMLTTFNTPFGRFRWFRMPYGDTEEDAIVDIDQQLKALMKRCRERGLVLNKDKLGLRETEIFQSDHKPLEPLHTAPKHLQRMLLRLQKYSTKLEYHPGEEMHLADTLSRAYLQNSDRTGALLDEIVHFTHIQRTVGDSLQEIRDETRRDNTLQELIHVILTGWPEMVSDVKDTVRPYFNFRDELVIQDGVIFCGDRIVIPIRMRQDMLCKIHKSHRSGRKSMSCT